MPLQPIVISILFHHYKELLQCISKVEELGDNVNVKEDMKYSTIEEEAEAKRMQEIPNTLDGFFLKKDKDEV